MKVTRFWKASLLIAMLLFCIAAFAQPKPLGALTRTTTVHDTARVVLNTSRVVHPDTLGKKYRLTYHPNVVNTVTATGNPTSWRNKLVKDVAGDVWLIDYYGVATKVNTGGGGGGGGGSPDGNGIYSGSGSLTSDVTVTAPVETTLAFDIEDGYYSFNARRYGSFTTDFNETDRFYLGEMPYMQTNEFSFSSPTVARLNVRGPDESLLHVGAANGFAGLYVNGDSVSVLRIGGITIQSDTNQLVPYTLSLPDTIRTGVLRANAANGRTFFDPNYTCAPSGTAGGDLSGTYPNPTVARIQGRTVTATVPTSGQVLKFDGTNWAPGSDATGGAPSGSAGGDLSGTYPNPTVARIQGQTVASTTPTTNQVLKFNGTNWAPAADATGASTRDEIGWAIDTLVDWNEYPLFINSSNMWEQVTVGSGATAGISSANSTAGRPGVTQTNTGTTGAASAIGSSLGNGNQGFIPGAGLRVRCAFNIAALPVTTDSIIFKTGFSTRSIAFGAAGSYLQVRALGGAAYVVQAVTSNGTAQTVTDVTASAGTLANTWKTWEVRYNSTTSVSFLLEDVVVATHTTNLDPGTTNRLFATFYHGKTGTGTGSNTALCDYIAFYYPCIRS
jgi:hypothetical protein